jgi:alginate O-acetyltransferase complex protein AlgJ
MRPDPLTRHEDARREVDHTDISPGVAWSLVALFVVLLFIPALIQTMDRADLVPTGSAVSDESPDGLAQEVLAVNRRWLAGARKIEDAIGERSLAVKILRPVTQWILSRVLGAGTEFVYLGEAPWLFYGPDVRYVTGQGFLTPFEHRSRPEDADTISGPPESDPRSAILDLYQVLRARDIELIVMPTPVKPSIEFEQLGGSQIAPTVEVENPSYRAFIDELRQQGVLVFDVGEVIRTARETSDVPFYLATDTHWRPDTVELVAHQLASFVADAVQLPDSMSTPLESSYIEVTNHGDTARLLGLNPDRPLFLPETVQIRRVTPAARTRWLPDSNADILLLGDSFTNVYSLKTMGWGESAGLAEQLSFEMRRSIDRLSQNDAGASAPRALLAAELGRGRDRLAGKRAVIFQFANRELAFGDWSIIDLTLKSRPDLSTFAVPPQEAQAINASGVIRAIGSIPRPESVPYNDQIVAIHVDDLTVQTGTYVLTGTEALVYVWGMQEKELTPINNYRIGDLITLSLSAWSNVSQDLDGINRGEINDPRVRLAEPWWGQLPEVLP